MEIWKPLRNFPSYDGSSEGRIRNIRTQKILRTQINEKGYETVTLTKNKEPHTVRVHKVIAETFLGNHPNMDVRHRDNNRWNNRVENLYWSTRQETIASSFERGDRLPNRRTSVRVIETGDTYISVSECARDLGVDRSAIFKCLIGTMPHVKGFHFERF